jgi:hypothetical protein
MHKFTRLGLVTGLFLIASAPAFSTQIFITNFTKNANLQTDYCSCYPTGLISDSNAYGTGAIGYNITPDGSGFNMEKIDFTTASGNSGYTTTISQNITNPIAVYLLLNIQGALAGKESAVVTIRGTGGAVDTFDLFNGQDVRSLYLNDAVNTFNAGSNTRNAYSSGIPTPGTLGQGVYVLDEVRLTLSAAFVGQQLLSIEVDETLGAGGLGVNGLPLLSAITVDGTVGTGPSGGGGTPGTPEPGSIAMMLGGASLLAIGRKRFAN